MKTKATKQPKQSKRAVQLKDIKPKKDAKAGGKAQFREITITKKSDVPIEF